MSDLDVSVDNRLFWILHVRMIAAGTVGGLVHPGTIEDTEKGLGDRRLRSYSEC